MGVDFRPDGALGHARWSYSGFNAFRCRLAKICGFDLEEMKGFGGTFQKPWHDEGGDLQPLLKHSDCDGELSPAECRKIAPALREAAAKLEDGVGYDKDNALKLAASMEFCADAGKPLEFR